MRLSDFFKKSLVHADRLQQLYDELDFHDKRTRSEWRDKLFSNNMVGWGKRRGIWRSINDNKEIQIVGATSTKIFQTNISIWRPLLLQQALVMLLAAIDKALHQATTTRKFVQLLRSGKLDDLMKNFPLSETYDIAMESRKRRGHGGKIRPRPANKIKEIVSAKLYESSFLSTNNLERICAANGVEKIFSLYASHLNRQGVEPLRRQWSLIYKKRNSIVHECGIVRTKISPKRIVFETINLPVIKKDIDFARNFGEFIANKLS